MTRVQAGVAALVALWASVLTAAGPSAPPVAADPTSQVGGDGGDIHDPGGKVRTPGALIAMVQGCATTLNLPWFPEEVSAVAAVLDRDHYHFGP